MRNPRSRHRLGVALAVLSAASLLAAGCTSSGGSSSGSSGGGSGSAGSSAADSAVLGTPHKAAGTPIKVGFVNDGQGDVADNTGAWDTAQGAAKYANDYLNGINGQVIQLVHCETKYTASGGTTCGVQMVNDKVDVVLAPAGAEDKYIFGPVNKAGIPYVALGSGDGGILTAPGAYVLQNGFAAIAAEVQLAKAKGIKKAGLVIIDVPAAAAVGPITKPIYTKAGVEQDFIPIAASVADQTGRLQQAINSGTGAFIISGTNSFLVASLKALRQLQFKGPIVIALSPVTKDVVDAVPGGLAGIVNVVAQTSDPKDQDVRLYKAVNAKYAVSTPGTLPEVGFTSVLGLQRALQGVTSAVDPKSIIAAMDKMPALVKLPLGGGITFQCGIHLLAIAPNYCTTQYLQATLDKNGQATSYTLGDAKTLLAS